MIIFQTLSTSTKTVNLHPGQCQIQKTGALLLRMSHSAMLQHVNAPQTCVTMQNEGVFHRGVAFSLLPLSFQQSYSETQILS